MAKELPYFKFYIGEWLNGDITIEDYECQGVFINVCAYYWQKDAELTLTVLMKRFRNYEAQINQLIESKLIKVIGENISISFLNEQMESKEIQKITNQKNGAKGGRPKKELSNRIYAIRCFNDDESFIKIGITKDTIAGRFSSKTGSNVVMPYAYDIILDELIDVYLSVDIESEIKKSFKSYDPKIKFGGCVYECFSEEYEFEIISFIKDSITNKKPIRLLNNNPTQTNIENRKEEENREEEIKEKKSKNTKRTIEQFREIARKSFENCKCSFGNDFKKEWFVLIQSEICGFIIIILMIVFN